MMVVLIIVTELLHKQINIEYGKLGQTPNSIFKNGNYRANHLFDFWE